MSDGTREAVAQLLFDFPHKVGLPWLHGSAKWLELTADVLALLARAGGAPCDHEAAHGLMLHNLQNARAELARREAVVEAARCVVDEAWAMYPPGSVPNPSGLRVPWASLGALNEALRALDAAGAR